MLYSSMLYVVVRHHLLLLKLLLAVFPSFDMSTRTKDRSFVVVVNIDSEDDDVAMF
jgi:hypothetical protein